MAHTSRVLHNSDKFLYFFYTGQTNADGLKEFIVVGNANGEAEWSVKADTGTKRSDDHGQTFTVKCDYQALSYNEVVRQHRPGRCDGCFYYSLF